MTSCRARCHSFTSPFFVPAAENLAVRRQRHRADARQLGLEIRCACWHIGTPECQRAFSRCRGQAPSVITECEVFEPTAKPRGDCRDMASRAKYVGKTVKAGPRGTATIAA